MLNIILPSLPYQRIVDPIWQEEMEVARACGYSVCLFDAEQEKLYQQPNSQFSTLYRGWMLSAVEYQQLAGMAPLLVSTDLYLASHQANGWYDSLMLRTILTGCLGRAFSEVAKAASQRLGQITA